MMSDSWKLGYVRKGPDVLLKLAIGRCPCSGEGHSHSELELVGHDKRCNGLSHLCSSTVVRCHPFDITSSRNTYASTCVFPCPHRTCAFTMVTDLSVALTPTMQCREYPSVALKLHDTGARIWRLASV